MCESGNGLMGSEFRTSSSMSKVQQSALRGIFNARKRYVFRDHVRVANSIFSRPCSCTASLREDNPLLRPKVITDATNEHLPKPPADHRELAKQQKLFITSPYSPGSPLLLPSGSDMFIKLQNLLRGLYPQFGFREVITPNIYKKSLWEKSGHWENYAEDMFEVKGRGLAGQSKKSEVGEDEEFGLKPMNCPGHCLLFASEKRSWRDMPVRFADFSALHRNEISGALSGLTRVRRFHQDDAHIFCRPIQVQEEIKKTLEFIDLIYSKIFHFGAYRLVLSTRPHINYIGTRAEWDRAEKQLIDALNHSRQPWSVNEGDGAFYGPKIDIILKDSDGKEHQTATIQLDFQLPQRFGLEYQAGDVGTELEGTVPSKSQKINPGPVTPIIIHRAILGSLERFMALLIEHYDGTYPFWISPRPATVISVTQHPKVLQYAQAIQSELNDLRGVELRQLEPSMQDQTVSTQASTEPVLRQTIEELGLERARETIVPHFDIDISTEGMGKKIRSARLDRYNFLILVGPQEAQSDSVTIQFWNQRRQDIVLQVADAMGMHRANPGKTPEQFTVQREQAIAFFRMLCTYHL